MQIGSDDVCKVFQVPADAVSSIDVQPTKGRKVTIMVNGATVAAIDTSTAVAADYLIAVKAFTTALMHTESLEVEANASGRTIDHTDLEIFGSLPIKDTTAA